jgi:SAM-dependent methyltransferase
VPDSGLTRLRRRSAHAVAAAGALGHRGAQRISSRLAPHNGPSLSGDRWVEWSFCMSRLADGPGRTLDFGADIAFLSLAAAQRGHDVTAFDRLASTAEFDHPGVRFVEADVLTHDFGEERFDQVINCSSVEHVGLGGRYGSSDATDGDLEAMAALRRVLTPQGRMILTIPVGRDLVCAPLHRIYGDARLPRLLDGFGVDEQQFWVKEGGRWGQADRARALSVTGSESFYALGLFVLSPSGS